MPTGQNNFNLPANRRKKRNLFYLYFYANSLVVVVVVPIPIGLFNPDGQTKLMYQSVRKANY